LFELAEETWIESDSPDNSKRRRQPEESMLFFDFSSQRKRFKIDDNINKINTYKTQKKHNE